MVTPLSGSLRVATSLVVVGVVGYAGYALRSVWIIPPLMVAFTVLYVAGKYDTWRAYYLEYGLTRSLINFVVTLPIQLVICGLCYLVGTGIRSLVGTGARMEYLTAFDWTLVGGLLAFALPVTALITWLEHTAARPNVVWPDHEPQSSVSGEPELLINPAPADLETFFIGPHFSQYDHADGVPETLPDAAKTQPGQIEATEKRLGVQLPPLLRKLYERQNGGLTGLMLVPATDSPRPLWADWRAAFSHDYDELKPLEDLKTYYDYFLEWGDPKDPDDLAQIPANAKNMIVLSIRYADTTYLDYSKPGEPTVGVVDFDPYTSEAKLYFDTFEDFFAALRRGKAI